MLTRPIAVGLVAGVIVAAGAGSYLAVRQNAADRTQLVDAGAQSATDELASAEPTGTATVVDATEATVDRIETVVSEEILTPSPVRSTLREQPVAAPPPPPPPNPGPAERAASPAPEPTPAVAEPTKATEADAVAEVAPAEPVTVQAVAEGAPDEPSPAQAVPEPTEPSPVTTARADLPEVEGWARPAATAPLPETVPEPIDTRSLITDIGSIDSSEPDRLPSFVELEIAADSVIGLRVDTGVSTRTAEVEDRVEARVTRDVLVAEQVAVPAGTRMLGSVVLVEKGGRLRDASRLGVRFHTLVMEDGLRTPVVTETIYREGRSRGSDSVAKIGGAAVGGAILGAIFGGRRGAAIGGSIGAAGGTAAALNGETEPAGLPPGTPLTVRLSRPVTVTIER